MRRLIEIATERRVTIVMFMVAIVFLAVFKRIESVAWSVGGLLALGISLMLGIRLYRKVLARQAGQDDAPDADPTMGAVQSVEPGR